MPEEVEAAPRSRRDDRASRPLGDTAHLLEVQRAAGNEVTTQLVKRSGAGALPPALQAGIERLSGVPVDDVTVHTGSPEPAKVNAHAYAGDGTIHIAPGQERHLAHEAWHVVQQRQGRVRATGSVGGQPLNDDPGLEAEADRMGELAQRAARDDSTIGSQEPD